MQHLRKNVIQALRRQIQMRIFIRGGVTMKAMYAMLQRKLLAEFVSHWVRTIDATPQRWNEKIKVRVTYHQYGDVHDENSVRLLAIGKIP